MSENTTVFVLALIASVVGITHTVLVFIEPSSDTTLIGQFRNGIAYTVFLLFAIFGTIVAVAFRPKVSLEWE